MFNPFLLSAGRCLGGGGGKEAGLCVCGDLRGTDLELTHSHPAVSWPFYYLLS